METPGHISVAINTQWNEGPPITAEDAVNLPKGCQFQAMSVSRIQIASLTYSCPQRTVHPACTTGSLKLMVYDDNGKSEIALAEEHRFDGGCPPPPMPAIPAAFEPDIAYGVAQSLVDGREGDVGKLLADKVRVVRAAKYASGSPEIEFSGNGSGAFVDQAKLLVGKLGKPESASCDATKSICNFTFNQKDRFLFAAIQTRNHQVEFVQFFYSTRAMVMERLNERH